jgi:uncharacterized membrane protein YuzA (DUF378 family)
VVRRFPDAGAADSGLNVGMLAVSGYNAAGVIFGPYSHIVYALVGVSAVWQLSRQRFR